MARMTKQRRAVLEILDSLDGELVSENGKGTALLLELLAERGEPTTSTALIGALHKMEAQGMIERDVRGKRTYGIALPGGHERRLAALEAASTVVDEPEEPETVLDHTEPEPEPAPVSTFDLNYSTLAAGLLDRVVEILTEEDSETLKVRLAAALDETQRLRTKLRDTQEDLHAVTMERDGLRQQRRSLEANIQQMLKNGSHDAGKSRRALERFMQEKPSVRA